MTATSALHVLSSYQLAVLAIGSIAFGLFVLFKAGSWTIGSAVFISRRLGLSQLFIGATVVAFGTSVPELVTSINANLSGYPGLSLGNVVGSNIANILLVIGATAIVFSLAVKRRPMIADSLIVLVATAALVYLMTTGIVLRWQGMALFGSLLIYIGMRFALERRNGVAPDLDEIEDVEITTVRHALLLLAGGLVGLIIGSEILVQGAVAAGVALDVPEAVIGVTVVALGTSLPELATCLVAALRRRTDMLVGNILGSNLFNILSIVGLTALIKPLVVEPEVMSVEMWVMAGTTLVFSVWLLSVARIGRALGAAMIAGYVAFILWQYRLLLPF